MFIRKYTFPDERFQRPAASFQQNIEKTAG